jgi:hypothetical protein
VRKFLLSFVLITSLGARAAWADPYKPNEAGVTMGRWHLNSRDVEANKKIFVALGGTAVRAGVFNIVRFPGVNICDVQFHYGKGVTRLTTTRRGLQSPKGLEFTLAALLSN